MDALEQRTCQAKSTYLERSQPIRLGNAHIFQDDCLQLLSHFADSSISGVVTDPPFGLKEFKATELAKKDSGRGGVWRIPPSFDGHTRSPLPRFTALNQRDLTELVDFFTEWSMIIHRILKPGAHVFIASSSILSQKLYSALINGGLEFRGEVIRAVGTLRGGDRPKNYEREFSQTCSLPRARYEPWGLFRKPILPKMTVGQCLRNYGTGALRRKADDSPFTDLIESERTPQAERRIANHPSLKPQSFMRQVVYAALPLGTGTLLDPFMGSGSTIAAAEFCGYSSIGIEMNPTYFRIAVEAIPELAALKVKYPHHKSNLLPFS